MKSFKTLPPNKPTAPPPCTTQTANTFPAVSKTKQLEHESETALTDSDTHKTGCDKDLSRVKLSKFIKLYCYFIKHHKATVYWIFKLFHFQSTKVLFVMWVKPPSCLWGNEFNIAFKYSILLKKAHHSIAQGKLRGEGTDCLELNTARALPLQRQSLRNSLFLQLE